MRLCGYRCGTGRRRIASPTSHPARSGLLGLALLMLLSGCETPIAELLPLNPPIGSQPPQPRVSGPVPTSRSEPVAFERRTRPDTARVPQPARVAIAPGGNVTLNFVDTDIREVARVILGTTLKLNYTIDPAVQGTATLETSQPLPRSQLLTTLETLLNENNATLVQRDGLYRVMPAAGAVANAPVVGAGAVGAGTQVVPLRYAAAKDLAKVIEPFVGEGVKVAPDPGRNALIVSGNAAARQTIVSLISSFDIDVLAGQSYAVIPAGNGSPEKLAGELEKIFRADGDNPLSGVVRVIPLQRANGVLVVSSQPRYIEEARRYLGLTRKVEDATARTWYVYYVQNGQSTDLENLLQRAFTPGHVSSAGSQSSTTAPGAEQLRLVGATGAGATGGLGQANGLGQPGGLGQIGGAGPAGRLGGLGSLGANAGPGTLPPGADLPPRGAEASAAPEDENRLRIIANRRNNALLIYATPNEYSVVAGMLRKIDIVPLQVLIEATIAEVTLNDELAYGTQFFLGRKLQGTLSFDGSGNNPITRVLGNPIGAANNFPGFVLSYGVREAINALASVTQVKVLSAPQVMVMDNEPARLQVGALVPVITQSSQSTITANAPIINNVDYRDTGVIMLVTPRVNSGGLVTLDISQEVSDVANTTSSTINSPTFNQRLIRTRVAVQDGQTVGMAGLIRDSDSQGNSGIPFIKDIPLIGTLASSQQNSRQRTELLVLITPRVVQDHRDARALTEDLRRQVIGAGLVPQELNNKPLRGSANPNRL